MNAQTRRVLGLALAAVAAIAAWAWYARFLPGSQLAPEDERNGSLVIGLSLANSNQTRWEVERDIMADFVRQHDAILVSANAEGDPVVQERQARELMDQGAQVLVVVAQDSEKAASIVEEAHKRGVKVIAYDRLIKNSDLDYYLTFDSVKVGEAEAHGVLSAAGGAGDFAYIGGSPTDNNATLVRQGSFSVLQPKIDSGEVRIVLDEQIPDWDADIAYRTMDAFLDRGGKIDGAVVANDGMAGGVIKALREHGLAGKVPVSGQDAELRACRDLVNGTQTLTVYKPLRRLAEEAVLMAAAAAKGEQLKVNASINNGKVHVPSRLLDVVMVTKDNLDDTVILDGFQSRADVYGEAE